MYSITLFVAQLEGGGAERMMVNLANGFADQGHKVHLVCSMFIGPFCDEVNSNVIVVDFKCSKVSKSVFLLRSFLIKESPDCLITTQFHASITAIIANKISGKNIPVVLREATTPSEAFKFKKRNPSIGSTVWNMLFKFIYNLANSYVAVSHGVKNDIIKFYNVKPNKVSVVPNPIITKDLYSKINQEVNHPFFADNSNSKIIISAGRIHSVKDFSTLIKAFKIVHQSLNVKLLILGNTNFNKKEFEILKNLVNELDLNDVINFTGFVKNPFKYFYLADVFVLSSLYEGMPGVIVQAMFCGCQIVSTNCKNGPSEILNSGEFGELVSVGDFEDMAKSIIKLINTPVSENVLRNRSMDYSIDITLKHYNKIIKSII